MVKSITVLKRKPGMSVASFQAYWRTTHAELVKKVPGLRKYAQCHTLLSGYRKTEPVYDGMAELRYDNTDAMRESEGTPEYAAVRADEPNLLDVGKLRFIITKEYELL